MDVYRTALKENDPEVYAAIAGEEERQRRGIELIPSENYTYPEVLAALGSVLTNKYAEGYPGRRYYGGQEFTDQIENLARDRAKRLFRCEHANVQPLSGSPMNQAVYLGFLDPGDTVLAMDLSHGGHLTHGAPVSHMGKIFKFVRYKTHPEDQGRIDFDELRRLALEHRPKLVLAGYTSYPRDYDYADFKRVADAVGALTMADVSHVGGLIAGGAMRNPVRPRLRRRHHHHPQDAARPARRHGAVPRAARQDGRRRGLSRPPGRPAHEHHRRGRDHAREGAAGGLPRPLPRGARQRQGAGAGPARPRRHAWSPAAPTTT